MGLMLSANVEPWMKSSNSARLISASWAALWVVCTVST